MQHRPQKRNVMHPTHGTSQATKMTYLRHCSKNRNVMRKHLPHKCCQKKNIPAESVLLLKSCSHFLHGIGYSSDLGSESGAQHFDHHIDRIQIYLNIRVRGVSNASADVGGEEADKAIFAFRESAASML